MKLDTKEDWWAAVEANWPKLKKLFEEDAIISNVNVNEILDNANKVSAMQGRRYGRIYEGFEDRTIYEAWDAMRQNKDSRLLDVFQTIWEEAPDAPYIHQWTFWGGFCDLCSEGPHCLNGEAADA